MPIQSSVSRDPAIGVAGMLADSGFHDVVSGVAAARKLVSIAITAANSDVYTLTITMGDGSTANYEYTADGSATTAEVTVGLRDLINAGSLAVLASGTDTPLLIEATSDGSDGDFTVTESETNLATPVVLVEQGAALSNGKYVVLDERRDLAGGMDYCIRAPRQASDITGGRGIGVVIEEFAFSQLPVEAGASYATALTIGANQCFNVLHKGRCLVKVEEAVTKGDQAYARYAAGGLGLGSFRKSTGTSEAAAIPGAKFLTTAAANGLAILEISY